MAKKEKTKKKDYSAATLKQLVKFSDEKELEIEKMFLQHSQGKLRNTASLKKEKRDLARINTHIAQKAQKLVKK